MLNQRFKISVWLLRLGIASVFIYAAIASFFEPNNWIGYLPAFLKQIIPAQTLLIFFSIYEISLGLWILSGTKTFYAALLAMLTLAGIITTNLNALDITFRDIPILFSAAALGIIYFKNKNTP